MAGYFLNSNPAEFLGILPEILMMVWAVVVLGVDLIAQRGIKRRTLGLLAAGGLLVILVVAFVIRPADPANILGGMIRNDLYTFAFRVVFIVGAALTCLVSIDFRQLRLGGEYFAIIIFAALGMSLMAGANDIVMLFVATETVSFALYLLAGFMRGNKLSAEAGVKYFVFGAVTSSVMLFGLSLFFGLSGGKTGYDAISQVVKDSALRVPVTFSALLVLVGFAFKTSAVPFQFWAPDVYTGAPTPVAGFISTASKAAGFAILIRFFSYVLPAGPDASAAAQALAWVLLPISILTMTVGSLMALVQKNVKRMLAYSSIAQAGYIFVGVTALAANVGNKAEALAAVIFYIATYMLTNIAAFAVVGTVGQRVGGDDVEHFNGLGRRSPYLALGMTAALLSLLGAPPLVGFAAKVLIFGAAISAGQATGLPQFTWMVVIAIVNVLISVVYYLNVVRAMYVEKTEHDSDPLFVPAPTTFVVLASAGGIVALIALSAPFWTLALDAARTFFKA